MSDFFADLERELRGAAERPRRLKRLSGTVGRGVAVGAALAAIALALVPAMVIFGTGNERAENSKRLDDAAAPRQPAVGTVIQEGEGVPPRQQDSTVVATGRTPIAGPWQIETYRGGGLKDPKSGEEYEPAGLRCLQIVLADPPPGASPMSGQCGEFPQTPGFGRVQTTVPGGRPLDPENTEILVYGRVPEQALGVDLRVPGRLPERHETFEGTPGERGDYYLIAVPPDVAAPLDLEEASVDWMAPDGGGRGGTIGLLPP